MNVVQARRRERQVRLVDGHEIGVGAKSAERAHDAITDMEARGAGADGFNDTGQLDAQHRRQLQRESVSNIAFADFPIDPVHAGGANSDQHLALSSCGFFDLGHFGGGDAAVGSDQYGALCGAHWPSPMVCCDD